MRFLAVQAGHITTDAIIEAEIACRDATHSSNLSVDVKLNMYNHFKKYIIKQWKIW